MDETAAQSIATNRIAFPLEIYHNHCPQARICTHLQPSNQVWTGTHYNIKQVVQLSIVFSSGGEAFRCMTSSIAINNVDSDLARENRSRFWREQQSLGLITGYLLRLAVGTVMNAVLEQSPV
jgi:hypothetical protein